MDRLKFVWDANSWDGPLEGLGKFNDELVWFDTYEEYEADIETRERLSDREVQKRCQEMNNIFTRYKKGELFEDELYTLLEPIELTQIRVYNVYKLSLLQKLKTLIHKKKFEIMVGYHCTYGKKKHFKMNRWFGLGSLLFELYYCKMKSEKEIDKGRIITQVSSEDCVR